MVPVRPRRPYACFAMAAFLVQPMCAGAQVTPPPADVLDPDSPLAPMADLGVAWPDLSVADAPAAGVVAATTVDAAAEQRYRVALAGLEGVGDMRLRPRFDGGVRADAGGGIAGQRRADRTPRAGGPGRADRPVAVLWLL